MLAELIVIPWLIFGSIYFLPREILLSAFGDGSPREKRILLIGEDSAGSERLLHGAREVLEFDGRVKVVDVHYPAFTAESLTGMLLTEAPEVAIASNVDVVRIVEQLGIPCILLHR